MWRAFLFCFVLFLFVFVFVCLIVCFPPFLSSAEVLSLSRFSVRYALGTRSTISQSTKFRTFFFHCVLLCQSCLLMYILEKINKKILIKSLNFAESNVHRKTDARGFL